MNTGLSRSTTINLSTLLPRKKVAARGKVEKRCVTNFGEVVTNLGEVVTNLGEVVEKFERAPCARTSLAPIARIAPARALRASVGIVVNMIANPPNAPRCTTQTTSYYYHA
jgi:hypothetical protein